jgi:hypothetical protein|tara:strand:- start:196 stop:636 length:441 start_codon:yes stop_codon:yes gene_type:complete
MRIVFCTSSVAIVQKNPKLRSIMWQRIQTLYMFLGAIAFFCVGKDLSNNIEALIAGLGVALLLANITYFRFRKRQFIVNRLAILAAFILEALVIYPVLQIFDGHLVRTDLLKLAAPLIAVIFIALANRAIQRDEEKVNSSARFRSK